LIDYPTSRGDRGFASATNEAAAIAGRVILARLGRKPPARRANERQRWFRRGNAAALAAKCASAWSNATASGAVAIHLVARSHQIVGNNAEAYSSSGPVSASIPRPSNDRGLEPPPKTWSASERLMGAWSKWKLWPPRAPISVLFYVTTDHSVNDSILQLTWNVGGWRKSRRPSGQCLRERPRAGAAPDAPERM
jgi:hypothetical protein